MSDLYGINESEEDISSFLQILLQNSSSSAPTTSSAAAGEVFIGGAAAPEPSTGIKFSDPSCFARRDSDGPNPSTSVKNLASSSEEPEASVRGNPSLSRSSKRSRAAEVHNMSEKRRRSRINEKLKALQNLIPNSNKTDKASMLDEAIEYLKQLQLQVQMLTMRNGLSLHPGYSLGSLQSMLAPSSSALESNDENLLLNTNRGAGPLITDQDFLIQGNLEPNDHSSSIPPMLVPSIANTSNSGIPPSFVPPPQNHYGMLNHFASTKDICRDDTLSRLQLDRNYNSGNNSSPGVSS